MLDQHVDGDRRDTRMTRDLAPTAWGRVLDADTDAGTVTITLPAIDGGLGEYGPVRYLNAGALAPEAGDAAFLIVDQDGEPAIAVVLTDPA